MTRTPILPPLRRTAADAERFARVVHADQVDKAGRPYVEHLGRVSVRAMARWMDLGLGTDDEELDLLRQIAWLHDVIEDTERTAEDLLDEGFHRYVVRDVKLISKPKGDIRYLDWIEHITMLGGTTVLIVKLADMEDNADPERLALLPEDVRARLIRKYEPALAMLRAAVERGAGANHER